MSGIQFERSAGVAPQSPNRADVALFVGAVARRSGARLVPRQAAARAGDPLYRWLEAERWTLEANRRERRPLEELLDIPVPLESFAEFDRLFAWENRAPSDRASAPAYLGMAVRAFFEEGGRRCYVVRVCDPRPIGAPGDLSALLVPHDAGRPLGSALDRGTWRGLWHLYGLPDVSFACLPDLPEACAPPPLPERPLVEPVAAPEGFVECSTSSAAPPTPRFVRQLAAPRCDHAGYQRWASTLRAALEGIERAEPTHTLREVQLIAAIPLPSREALPEADSDMLGYLSREHGLDVPTPTGLASSFLQLVYPWLRSPGSDALPGGVQGPEGAACGALARNALTRGTFRSAAGTALQTVLDVEPRLRRRELSARVEPPAESAAESTTAAFDPAEQLAQTPLARRFAARGGDSLLQRVTLVGPTPRGMRLLSDVSTSRDPGYRQAHVRRLSSAVVRAARQIGESSVFEASGPRLWESIQDQMKRMLRGLWRAGALNGEREADAFRVRCDRSTMSQNDFDNGRVVCEIELAPAAAIDSIVVSLSLQGGAVETRAA